MIRTIADLQEYLLADKIALGKKIVNLQFLILSGGLKSV
jgi:hypothetical protein